jgi:hypothetical protein
MNGAVAAAPSGPHNRPPTVLTNWTMPMRDTLTNLSLIGVMLMATVWFASYWQPYWSTSDERTHFRARKGSLVFWRSPAPIADGDVWPTPRIPGHLNFNQLTLSWLPYVSTRRGLAILLPIWLPLAVLAVLPIWSLVTRRRTRERLTARRCVPCGYDLRASPDRCPECGSPSAPKEQALLVAKPSRLMFATKCWLLLLAALSLPCIVLSNPHWFVNTP